MPAASIHTKAPVDDAFDHRQVWLGALLIFALTLIAYLPVMQHGGFIWDDDQYVEKNRLLQEGWEGLQRMWIPRQTPQYYPIVFTTFWIENQIWDLHPRGYHIVNVILHALNAILVWRLATMLRIPWAWLIGAVFALHPVLAESVAWITERKNTLSALFYLLAAITYLKFDWPPSPSGRGVGGEGGGRNRWAWYVVSFICFVLALLSKSVTCSLPAALILMMLWQRKPLTIARLAPLMPFFVVGLLLALNTAQIEREHVGAFGEDFDFSAGDRAIIASRALLFYAGKIVWPWPIVFTYERWNIDDSNVLQYLWVLVAALIAVALIVLYRRGLRGPGLAIAFFAGTVFPALGFVNIYPMMFSFVADHFQYLASLGIIALVVGALAHLFKTRERMVLASVLMLAPLGAITFVQCYAYENAETLYRDTIAKNDDAFMAHNNLATELLRQAEDASEQQRPDLAGELQQEAALHLQKALKIKPRYPQALGNMSDLLALHGQNEEALRLAQQALEVILNRPDIQAILQSTQRPEFAPISGAFRAVATLQARTNSTQEAKQNYIEALAWNPNDIDLLAEYAQVLMAMNDVTGAAKFYERALKIDPNNVAALGNLATVRERENRHAEARALLSRALGTAPPGQDGLAIYLRMVRLLATCPESAVRDTRQAVAMMERLVEQTQRGDPSLLDVLSSVLAEDGRTAEAIATGEEAASLAERLRFDDLAKQIRARVDALREGSATSAPATAPQ